MRKSNYKEIEKERYNEKAKIGLAELDIQESFTWGYESLPKYLQSPYKFYHEVIKLKVFKGAKIIDVCCGDGLHSFTGLLFGGDLTVTDIAENNVKITKNKAELLGFNIFGIVEDVDNLNLKKNSYDLVTCAGSLSYVDLISFIPKIKNTLNPGGYFIIVDSFNHNFFYRLNRFFHYLKGNRTARVNKNIPSHSTILFIKEFFDEVEIKYFGIFTFVIFVLKPFFSDLYLSNLSDMLDSKFSFLKKYSFKVVIIAKKTK
jgi:2-polyprenyl-3-methyl-5-hydroxy-6-metoxy-1,4-benzoquinol methylase